MNAIVERREQPVTAVAAVTPAQMLQLAFERGADLDKLQQLMDLQERWEATQARKAFVAAMAEFKANPPEIIKEKHVSFKTNTGMTEYDHATLGNVCAATIKGLAVVSISHRWDVTQSEGITVKCILTHAQGHSESVSLTAAADTSGGKNSIQALGSAITYLQRYTLLAATGLAALDQDDDGKAGGTGSEYFITENQIHDLMALAEEVKADRAAFLKYMKVTQLAEIPRTQYSIAVAGLESKRK